MLKYIITSIIIIFLIGCQNIPNDVEKVLNNAGDNRKELEKVIAHYQDSNNKEKLKAAYFLIGNMSEKFYYDGENVQNFKELFFIIDSLWKTGVKLQFEDSLIATKWDSIANLYGEPNRSLAEKHYDAHYLTAEYLIKNIDQAFHARDSLSWCKALSFENFCEYVLPYRVGTEEPENWREILSDRWKIRRDTMSEPSSEKLAHIINYDNHFKMSHMKIFWRYPFDLSASQMEASRLGSCKHTVYYTAMAMRANGIPVGVDYAPAWAGSSQGHEWNVLLQEDGTFFPFDAIQKGVSRLDLSMRKVGKIFRETYTPQSLEFSSAKSDIPRKFFNYYRKDVTQEYVKTYDVTVPVKPFSIKKDYALICSFDNKNWIPQYWGKINNNKATFKNMGSGVVYSTMYYHNGSIHNAGEPFLLDTLGKIHSLAPDESIRQNMLLARKYPLTTFMQGIMSFVVGNSFQGANARDFKDSVTLYKIINTPTKIETEQIVNSQKFRYVRMLIPRGGRGDMAEMEFYGLSDNGKDTIKLKGTIMSDPEEAAKNNEYFKYPFDGNLLTYFLKSREAKPWVGLDFGKPRRIVKIRYCPRSDVNFIEVGHIYELCYLKNNKWVSMGRQVATDQQLIYKNVPSKALYILHDHTKGKEERIFTYENEAQIWW